MKRLFIDMDGTLAEFQPLAKIEDLLEKGYFFHLSPMQPVVSAVRELISEGNIEVYTLSAVLKDNPYALTEKKQWLKAYLPELPEKQQLFCECGQSKREFIRDRIGAGEFDYLLDDYTKNLLEWGQGGIKLLNGINHTKGTWQGNRIRANRSEGEIAANIRAIVERGEERKESAYHQEDKTLKAWQRFEWNRNKAMLKAGFYWKDIQPFSMLKPEAGAELRAELAAEEKHITDREME